MYIENKKNKTMFLISKNLTESLVESFYNQNQKNHLPKFTRKGDGTISLRMEVPGFTRDNLWVQLMNGLLNVSGKYKEDGVTYKMDTTLRVPEGVDYESARADVENGILTVTMATKVAEKKCYNLLKK